MVSRLGKQGVLSQICSSGLSSDSPLQQEIAVHFVLFRERLKNSHFLLVLDEFLLSGGMGAAIRAIFGPGFSCPPKRPGPARNLTGAFC
jgi:hypothetical protein